MFFGPSPIDKHLAKRLKMIRYECGVTQYELGELIGICSQQIQKYETAVNKISASRLYEICRVLNKPITSFFEGIDIEDGYYNFKFTAEEIVEEEDKIRAAEIKNLVKYFSKVDDQESRVQLINLVQSISTQTKPFSFRHKY